MDRSNILFYVVPERAGQYNISITPYNNMTGEQVGRPVNTSIYVSSEANYLFDNISIGPWSGSSWRTTISNGTEMNFSVSANTTPLWNGEPWNTYYNWTITVIDPDGMTVGGDLGVYNTGANVNDTALNSTSVVSAWENGYNGVFYTIWNKAQGVRFSGNAAMTPTGKQLTYASDTYAAWTSGTWTPQGSGYITFPPDRTLSGPALPEQERGERMRPIVARDGGDLIPRSVPEGRSHGQPHP